MGKRRGKLDDNRGKMVHDGCLERRAEGNLEDFFSWRKGGRGKDSGSVMIHDHRNTGHTECKQIRDGIGHLNPIFVAFPPYLW